MFIGATSQSVAELLPYFIWLGLAHEKFAVVIAIISVVCLFSFYSLASYKECRNYTWLNESYRNEHFSDAEEKCDKASGWYRFGGKAGNKMTTSCLAGKRQCGTLVPGWLKGAHPSVNDGIVLRNACFKLWGRCCRMEILNIKVLNCGPYYIYFLRPIRFTFNSQCNARYCATFN